jgi:hypothetical protein
MAFTTSTTLKDYTSFAALESSMFVRWEIPTVSTIRISDYYDDVTIDTELYTGEGTILDITGSKAELRLTPSQVSVTLSGVPSGEVTQILNNEIKGSTIRIIRAFWNPTTQAEIDAVVVFRGIVINWAVEDDVNPNTRLADTRINLTCNSIVEVLNRKVAGRRTNPVDFSSEQSMDRVPSLVNTGWAINFGGRNG